MKIMVSACLLGKNGRYDGGNNLDLRIMALSGEHELVPVCPEVMGGLPIPRIPSEIRLRRLRERCLMMPAGSLLKRR